MNEDINNHMLMDMNEYIYIYYSLVSQQFANWEINNKWTMFNSYVKLPRG